MVQTVSYHRKVLLDLVRGPWDQAWLVAGRISSDAVTLLLPHLQRPGVRIRVLTCLDPRRVAEGKLDLGALQLLRSLPSCELRHQPDLAACVYAFGPAGGALVTGSQLTLEGLDGSFTHGALLEDPVPTLTELAQWWERSPAVDDEAWNRMVVETSERLEAHTLSEEIARVGAFVRVAMRGTRRTRRLDPREYGVPEGEWGRAVRPVEVALFKLDEVIRAKDDLEELLAENGLEWNGYFLVPRHFLEREWPRLFAARERKLKDRLQSPDGRAALKSQLGQARRELEAFFGEIYPRADAQGMAPEVWVDMQATKVLADTVTSTILEDSGLEYRVLTILPEDPRSVEELQRLLQDPKLRSVQLTFHI